MDLGCAFDLLTAATDRVDGTDPLYVFRTVTTALPARFSFPSLSSLPSSPFPSSATTSAYLIHPLYPPRQYRVYFFAGLHLQIYHHTFYHFKQRGTEAVPVDLEVSFGKGEKFWTNVFPTELVAKHRSEIKRFQWAMKIMRWTELFCSSSLPTLLVKHGTDGFLRPGALIPIKVSLRMFFFSNEFINFMIYPSLALFLGTGNATPDLPSIMMERLYTSPTYGMWYPVDPVSLSSNKPPMVVFPEESKFYNDWKEVLQARGVNVRLNTEVTSIPERSKRGVKVTTRRRRPQEDHHNPNGADKDLPEQLEQYDEIVLAVLAPTAKVLLGKQARWIEKKILGNTKWSSDVTYTHHDLDCASLPPIPFSSRDID